MIITSTKVYSYSYTQDGAIVTGDTDNADWRPTGAYSDFIYTNVIDKAIETRMELERTLTNGMFQNTSLKFTSDGTMNEQYQDFSFPFPINVISVEYHSNNTIVDGDMTCFVVSPDTVIGVLTDDVSIGDTILPVSATVIENIKSGYAISLSDGINVNKLKWAYDIDTENGTIKGSYALTNNFLASSPTYVRISVPFSYEFKPQPNCKYEFAKDTVSTSYVPANTIMRLIVYPSTAAVRTITLDISYYC